MSVILPTTWTAENQMHLVEEFAALRCRLADEPADRICDAPQPIFPPAAIDVLAQTFGLSRFEREIILLCAGVEMDSALAQRCVEISARPQRNAVTFSLAMAVLADPHWSALAPSSPLRRFRLIEMELDHGVTAAPLRIAERVLHYLAGVNELDQRLQNVLTWKAPSKHIADEHRDLVTDAIQPSAGGLPPATALHFWGDDAEGHESVAALIAQRAGRQLFILREEETPAAGGEMDQFLHMWMRESLLIPAFLLLQWGYDAPSAPARCLAERLPGPLMIASREPLQLHRPFKQFEVNKPGPGGQRRMWQQALGPAAAETRPLVDAIAAQFRLGAETIAEIAASVPPSNALWNACCAVARPQLEGLAERIVPIAQWDDLVLPEMQKQTLSELAAQSRHRMTVYEDWGFAAKDRCGLGLSALFSGVSGTGKTMAAEVLAGELNVYLYRIDLSAVVSKYIGETEKNLKRVFDAAESGGVVLLFDEADALFGKRSEVKDSHDRYANIEVSYLLQRMESFQGISILTTNQKDALDRAFQRRLRFVVDFPFPGTSQREAIWSRVFPVGVPTADLQPRRLSSLNMTGGNIRSIALNAAFLAAGSAGAVGMSEVLHATQSEALKVERPLTERETKGWVV